MSLTRKQQAAITNAEEWGRRLLNQEVTPTLESPPTKANTSVQRCVYNDGRTILIDADAPTLSAQGSASRIHAGAGARVPVTLDIGGEFQIRVTDETGFPLWGVSVEIPTQARGTTSFLSDDLEMYGDVVGSFTGAIGRFTSEAPSAEIPIYWAPRRPIVPGAYSLTIQSPFTLAPGAPLIPIGQACRPFVVTAISFALSVGSPSVVSVAVTLSAGHLGPKGRLQSILCRALAAIAADLRKEFAELLTPQNIAIAAGVIALGAWGPDEVLAALATAYEAIENAEKVAKLIIVLVESDTVATAIKDGKTAADLNAAGKALSDVWKTGISTLVGDALAERAKKAFSKIAHFSEHALDLIKSSISSPLPNALVTIRKAREGDTEEAADGGSGGPAAAVRHGQGVLSAAIATASASAALRRAHALKREYPFALAWTTEPDLVELLSFIDPPQRAFTDQFPSPNYDNFSMSVSTGHPPGASDAVGISEGALRALQSISPGPKGPCWRVITPQLATVGAYNAIDAALQPWSIVTESTVGMASTQSSAPPNLNGNAQAIVMIIAAYSGRDVSFLDDTPQAERVFLPGTRYLVASRQYVGQITMVTMFEIDPEAGPDFLHLWPSPADTFYHWLSVQRQLAAAHPSLVSNQAWTPDD